MRPSCEPMRGGRVVGVKEVFCSYIHTTTATFGKQILSVQPTNQHTAHGANVGLSTYPMQRFDRFVHISVTPDSHNRIQQQQANKKAALKKKKIKVTGGELLHFYRVSGTG